MTTEVFGALEVLVRFSVPSALLQELNSSDKHLLFRMKWVLYNSTIPGWLVQLCAPVNVMSFFNEHMPRDPLRSLRYEDFWVSQTVNSPASQ